MALIVGSSFLAIEVACAILQWYPHVKPVMLVKGSHIMDEFLTQVSYFQSSRICTSSNSKCSGRKWCYEYHCSLCDNQ